MGFGKVYNGDETVAREAIYNQAVVEMEAHNADETQTYTQGVNQFSDLSLEEFQALPIRGLIASAKSGLPKVGVHEYNGETLPPPSIGSPRVPSPQSRTRASVALAGHSLPQVALKVRGKLPQGSFFLCQSNSWLTV